MERSVKEVCQGWLSTYSRYICVFCLSLQVGVGSSSSPGILESLVKCIFQCSPLPHTGGAGCGPGDPRQSSGGTCARPSFRNTLLLRWTCFGTAGLCCVLWHRRHLRAPAEAVELRPRWPWNTDSRCEAARLVGVPSRLDYPRLPGGVELFPAGVSQAQWVRRWGDVCGCAGCGTTAAQAIFWSTCETASAVHGLEYADASANWEVLKKGVPCGAR